VARTGFVAVRVVRAVAPCVIVSGGDADIVVAQCHAKACRRSRRSLDGDGKCQHEHDHEAGES
jgi:hypothetical protein